MVNKFPVSIKGIIPHNKRILLLKNEREEWELPGGKLELNEDPMECLTREIFEEIGIEVDIEYIVDSWVYEVIKDRRVLIITYGCSEIISDRIKVSSEHSEGRWFAWEEIGNIKLPIGYRRSIKRWREDLP